MWSSKAQRGVEQFRHALKRGGVPPPPHSLHMRLPRVKAALSSNRPSPPGETHPCVLEDQSGHVLLLIQVNGVDGDIGGAGRGALQQVHAPEEKAYVGREGAVNVSSHLGSNSASRPGAMCLSVAGSCPTFRVMSLTRGEVAPRSGVVHAGQHHEAQEADQVEPVKPLRRWREDVPNENEEG